MDDETRDGRRASAPSARNPNPLPAYGRSAGARVHSPATENAVQIAGAMRGAPVLHAHLAKRATSTVRNSERVIASGIRNAISSFRPDVGAMRFTCDRRAGRRGGRRASRGFPASGGRLHNHDHTTIMEIFDAFHLARLQFAFTVSFHIVFPAISIGMASFLAVLEWRWLATGDAAYKSMFQFWSKIFAVGFG
ncbi:cytochrome ubiquinol oxidase subunit I, partial [Burkholderia ubonensis]|uniref:cytochrome ubiquinol oxidase subunit I n=1 Tax=Burkholderia ubonensis TaxID=101571 RepID=UPI00210DD98C